MSPVLFSDSWSLANRLIIQEKAWGQSTARASAAHAACINIAL
jgi:hypothetical protein